MKIENENLLRHALKNGINLFVGAGFSTLAKDRFKHNLPVGNELLKELQKEFNKVNSKLNLPQLSSILENTDRVAFYKYLTNRFSVEYIDPLYSCINNLNIRSIYTTNIDNLIPQIVAQGNRYLNDQMANGPAIDIKAINYIPLHGNVDARPQKFIFDVNSLANIYNDAPRIWSCLSREMETVPTLFLGYSYSDTSVIQAATSKQTFTNAQKNKWILLKDVDSGIEEYYVSLGFNIILGDIKEFLVYLSQLNINQDEEQHKIPIDILAAYVVPHSIYEVKRRRPIRDFFTGSSPIWSDILENQIYKTHYLSLVQDRILDKNKKGVIIIGAPVSGKSTLLMQIANELVGLGDKLYFESLPESKAKYISKLIGKSQGVIFIDDLYESIEALTVLDNPNIKIVAAERSHNYGIISHLIDETKFTIVNITALKDSDIQGIYDSLPTSIRSEYLHRESELNLYSKDSLFEFVIRNIKGSYDIKNRYKTAIRKMEEDDPDLAEFLVLCAYMHSCRIPLSSEMAHAYFSDYSYNDIFDIRDDAKDLVNDYIPLDSKEYPDMDYYYPRSRYIAEIIRDSCSQSLLKKVVEGVINNIPKFIICNYKTFRKYAFDKVLMLRAFNNWKDGKKYYESAFVYDERNPYVLQQGALYLANKGNYDDAFSWIDKAISMTDDKYFSIRNTHAIILFNANIGKNQENVRYELDSSMHILEKCIYNDKRKRFHAQAYGTQAISYYGRFKDDIAKGYLKQAEKWLNSEIDHSAWDTETRKLRDKIRAILSSL